MSCQKGASGQRRSRGQKHQNTHTFKNTLHDTSKQTKRIIKTDNAEVCKRCYDVIQWKITYKKYKPLTVPKKCTKCEQKTILDAYHILCIPCGQKLDICCKCGKKEEIIAHKALSYTEKSQALAELEAEVKNLPERKRRAYQRYIDKLEGKKKKKKKKKIEDQEDVPETETLEIKEPKKPMPKLSQAELFKCARLKLDELKKGLNDEDDDFLDDLDDLDIEESDEEDDDEEEDEE